MSLTFGVKLADLGDYFTSNETEHATTLEDERLKTYPPHVGQTNTVMRTSDVPNCMTPEEFCLHKNIPYEWWPKIKGVTQQNYSIGYAKLAQAHASSITPSTTASITPWSLTKRDAPGRVELPTDTYLPGVVQRRPDENKNQVYRAYRADRSSLPTKCSPKDFEFVVGNMRQLQIAGRRNHRQWHNGYMVEIAPNDMIAAISTGSFGSWDAAKTWFTSMQEDFGREQSEMAMTIIVYPRASGPPRDGSGIETSQLLPFHPAVTFGTRARSDQPRVSRKVIELLAENPANDVASLEHKLPTPEETLARTKCANCDRFGHSLGHCVWPIDPRHGDIQGCPICNTKMHGWDSCPHAAIMNDEMVLTYLLNQRAGKCQIRSEVDVYDALRNKVQQTRQMIGSDELLPWTRETTLFIIKQPEIVDRLQNWSYVDLKQGVVQDPQSEMVKVFGKKPPCSTFTVWLEALRHVS